MPIGRKSEKMNIVVCIKAVKSTLVFSDSNYYEEAYFFNPYDLKALEECIKLKSSQGVTITCILMGPKDTASILEKSLAMGVDQAILLNDDCFAGSDTIATSYILSKSIEKLENYDMIVCGEKAIDGETGQVVFGLGERLGIPVVTNVSEILSVTEQQWSVSAKGHERVNKITGKFPIVLSISEFSTTYPKISLLAMKRAKMRLLRVQDAFQIDANPEKCGLRGSRTRVIKMRRCFAERSQKEIIGSTEEKVRFILNQLNAERKF